MNVLSEKELSIDDLVSRMCTGSKAQIWLWERGMELHPSSKKGYAHNVASLIIQDVVSRMPVAERPKNVYSSVLKKYGL